MMPGFWVLKVLLASLLLVFSCVNATAVISIDFGEEIRVGLIKVGQRSPMDLVLNEESMRKSSAVVAITKDEVFVNTSAKNIAARMPENAYGLLKNLLGRRHDQVGKHFKACYASADLAIDPDRVDCSAIVIRNAEHPDPFTVEELVSYILLYVKKIADAAAGESVRECVITIPPYFNTFARMALLDAASLAGLSVLELMHDVTAAAYNYSLSVKSTDVPQHFVFSSLGHTTSSFAHVSIVSKAVTGSYGAITTVPHLEVHEYQSLYDLGGLDIDLIIRDKLLKEFFAMYPSVSKEKVEGNMKVMNRLLREASKAKQSLAISNDYTFFLDNLYDNLDLTMSITRQDLDFFCTILKERFKMLFAGITKPEVANTVLVGGNSRTFFLQELFKDASLEGVKKGTSLAPLAMNINADEAVALGACLRAAVLSRKFVVTQDIRIKESYPFNVILRINDGVQVSNDDPNTSTVSEVTVFTPATSLDSKKIITLRKKTDFSISVLLKDTRTHFDPVHISTVMVSNVESVLSSINEDVIEEEPTVKIGVKLSNNGIVSVDNAHIQYAFLKTITIPAAEASTASANATGTATSNSDAKTSTEGVPGDELPVEDKPDESVTSEEVKKEEPVAPIAEPTYKTVKKTRTLDLGVSQSYVMSRLSSAQISGASTRAAAFEAFRKEKYLYESTRNDLESLAYQFRYMLDEKEWTDFMAEETQSSIRKDLSRILDDLDSDQKISLDQLKKELDILKGWLRPIEARKNNFAERPDAIRKLEISLKDAEAVLTAFEPKPTTSSDVLKQSEALEKLISDTRTWLSTRIAQQDTLPTYETPILWAKDLLKKSNELADAATKFKADSTATPKKPTVEKPASSGDDKKPKFDFDFEKLKKDMNFDDKDFSSEKFQKILDDLKNKMPDASVPTADDKAKEPAGEPTSAEGVESVSPGSMDTEVPAVEHDEL